MSAGRIPPMEDPLQRALREARQRDEAQQQMALVLQLALMQPHQVLEIRFSRMGLRRDADGTRWLMVGRLTGDRIDLLIEDNFVETFEAQVAQMDAQSAEGPQEGAEEPSGASEPEDPRAEGP